MGANAVPYSITDNAVAAAIAAAEGYAPDALWIERGIVWRLEADGSLRSVCAVDTPYWHEQAAAALTSKTLARAALR